MFWRIAMAVIAAIAISAPSAAQATRPRAVPPSHAKQASAAPEAAVQEFSARVNSYLELRKQKAGTSVHPTQSAQKIVETTEQLRSRIQQARANARQGEIFTPAISAYFHKQLAAAFRGPTGARVLASLRRAEPVKGRLKVNEPYPEGIPLQSMPPSLLMKLPKLPKELEYRIVGRDLVLRDTAPNLVVDILPDAVPQP